MYKCQYKWPAHWKVQGGSNGLVFCLESNYRTAFFEAFSQDLTTFIRGEGDSIEKAEDQAWEKYQCQLECSKNNSHDFGRLNGGTSGRCSKCSVIKSKAFSPLTRCQICNEPTMFWFGWNEDGTERKIPYCEKHFSQSEDSQYANIVYNQENYSEEEIEEACRYIELGPLKFKT